MACSLRPFLGVGKYSEPDSSIDGLSAVSASIAVILGPARNSWTAVLLVKQCPAGERYVIRTSDPTRRSLVIQSDGSKTSSESLLAIPTPCIACPRVLMTVRWVHFFPDFTFSIAHFYRSYYWCRQAFPNFQKLSRLADEVWDTPAWSTEL